MVFRSVCNDVIREITQLDNINSFISSTSIYLYTIKNYSSADVIVIWIKKMKILYKKLFKKRITIHFQYWLDKYQNYLQWSKNN